ncbi:class I SAM-dependent methyltransferase [Vibrio sp.]|nr:class I SAM-dependent methyltransferase [Vibrio sp.]
MSSQFNPSKEKQSFEQFNSCWKPFWPHSGDRVLEIGAGYGNNVSWLVGQKCEVIAVESDKSKMEIGSAQTSETVTWVKDELPSLSKIHAIGIRFDLILVSLVWKELSKSYRTRAFRKLVNLLAPNGKLIFTLQPELEQERTVSYSDNIQELESFAKEHALKVCQTYNENNLCTIVMNLPDDGSGDLIRVRHIIVNDSKSATYKLALLRTLLRIADAHSGAVIDRSDGKVTIPAGLIALYWMRQFKRLIDIDIDGCGGIQQNSSTSKGLGFVKDDGWNQLRHITPEDLSIGAMFVGSEAKALQRAMTHCLQTIKNGPVTFIYQGDKSNPIFEINKPLKSRKTQESLIIDSEFLNSFGEFVLDESLWDCLRLYCSWIEPLVVNQWISEMQRFELNRQRNISLQTYYDHLVWIDKKHDTKDVRKRIDQLRANKVEIQSVWSGSKLRGEYHIDHCLPFSYWPNNDKWNLLPTSKKENLNKNNKVPTLTRYISSKHRILSWWQLAWDQDSLRNRFFIEASMSLPNVSTHCDDFEEVFEAMGLQIKGVKSRLLISEW